MCGMCGLLHAFSIECLAQAVGTVCSILCMLALKGMLFMCSLCRSPNRQNDNGFLAQYVHGKTCIFKAAATIPEAATRITSLKDVMQQAGTNFNIRVVYQGEVGGFGTGERSSKVFEVSCVLVRALAEPVKQAREQACNLHVIVYM